MADTTFALVQPLLKAVDEGDTTHSVRVVEQTVPGGGTNTVFANTNPPLKAIDLGDGTYAMSITYQ